MAMLLKEKLLKAGFDSNASYDHVVKCFLETPNDNLRCLGVDGDEGRHKTVFAHALAQALGNQHILYFEYGLDEPSMPTFVKVDEEGVVAEPPVAELDKIMSEACALSEAESTAIILDQLQLAEFKQHIRLQSFIKTAMWTYADVTCYANKDNLQVYLISEDGLSPILQRLSFRIWLPKRDQAIRCLRSTDVDLSASSNAWLKKLIALMDALNVSPSMAEYKRLAYDIEMFVRTRHQLKESIMGRIKGVEYDCLHSEDFDEAALDFMNTFENSLYIQESIEIKSDLGNL